MKISIYSVVLMLGLLGPTISASAAEEHGHCSGTNVCKGDAACEKKGFKETTREQCAKIEGAKFEASSHAGEAHKDDNHDHKKK